MGVQAYGVFFGFAAISGGMAVDRVDLAVNYARVNAVVTSAVIDCFVKEGNKAVLSARNNSLAYMHCDDAPFVAAQHGLRQSAVRHRVSFSYTYTSPVDGKTYSGESSGETDELSHLAAGGAIPIYAHNKNPATSRY
jgi:hypothetical protein